MCKDQGTPISSGELGAVIVNAFKVKSTVEEKNNFQEMWAFILPELLKAIEAEPENEVLAELLASLARC